MFGHMSKLTALRPSPTELTARQAATLERLVAAAAEEARARTLDEVTVRTVARRAGVVPATAYNYVSSRDQLFTELFLRRLEALPPTDFAPTDGAVDRVSAVFAELSLLVADEPSVAAACTLAMLGSDPAVAAARDRIGRLMRSRLAAALGIAPAASDTRLDVLELALSGALIRAGLGYMPYSDLPALLAETSRLVITGGIESNP